ncbi:MAG: DUF3187 family protein, partial [Thermodesulfobacteriota bacterium]|nr:DUF3187 family protein [Thermodesulfobacteriota bacterium]
QRDAVTSISPIFLTLPLNTPWKAPDNAAGDAKWTLSNGNTVEFALLEDVITWDNSPDFGVHLAYSNYF